MRRLALVGVLAACNQIYGLEPTKIEEEPPPDATPRTTRLSYLVGPGAVGAPSLVPITPDPMVKASALDGELRPATYTADGNLFYPAELGGAKWRLEYTPPGDVPHEVQWQPPDLGGHVVVSVFGPPARTRVASQTGYRLTHSPGGNPYTFVNPVVYTTGYWTAVEGLPSGTSLALDLHEARPRSGDYGQPDPTTADYVLAFDYTSQNNCRVATRTTGAVVPSLTPGMLKDVGLPLFPSAESIAFEYPAEAGQPTSYDAVQARLREALGPRTGTEGGRTLFARIPSTDMPGFTSAFANVPAPLLLVLADCPMGTTTTPAVPTASVLAFPQVAYAFAMNDRTVNGVQLRSSIAAIAPRAAAGGTITVRWPVPAAVSPRLGTIELATVDGQMIANEPVDLSFEVAPTELELDYFEVTLYKLGAGVLEKVRVYIGPVPTERTIRFDPSVMTPGVEYVFAIRTYRGRPQMRNYDFVPTSPVQAVATIFTRTFLR